MAKIVYRAKFYCVPFAVRFFETHDKDLHCRASFFAHGKDREAFCNWPNNPNLKTAHLSPPYSGHFEP
jgi:hypothetical protein